MAYAEKEINLEPGHLIATYSDGYNETPNAEDDEYGEERLHEDLKEVADQPLQAIVSHMNGRVEAFQGNLPNHDDKTLVLVKRLNT